MSTNAEGGASLETAEKSAQSNIQELPNVYLLFGYRGEKRTAMIEQIVKVYGAQRINVASIAEEERGNPCSSYRRTLALFHKCKINISDELACILIRKKITDDKGLKFVVEDYPLAELSFQMKAIPRLLAPFMNIQMVLCPLTVDMSLAPQAETISHDELCDNIKDTVKTYMGDLNVDVDYKAKDEFIRAKVNSKKSYEEIFADVKDNYDALLAHKWNFSKE